MPAGGKETSNLALTEIAEANGAIRSGASAGGVGFRGDGIDCSLVKPDGANVPHVVIGLVASQIRGTAVATGGEIATEVPAAYDHGIVGEGEE